MKLKIQCLTYRDPFQGPSNVFTKPFCNLFIKEDTPNCLSFKLYKTWIHLTDFRVSLSLRVVGWTSSLSSATILKGGTPVFNDWDKQKEKPPRSKEIPISWFWSIIHTCSYRCLQRLPYFPSAFKKRNQALGYLVFLVERWRLAHGTQDKSLNRLQSSFVVVLGGSGSGVTSGNKFSRQVPHPKQIPFGQISQRHVFSKIGLKLKPALVGSD